MNDADRDVREALDRLARPAPPPLDTLGVLAAGRRARRRRSLLTAGGAVAGLVVVVAGAGLLRAGLPDPGTGGLTPAATSPAPATSAPAAGIGWQQPPVPGLSPDEARRIARGCAESFGSAPGRRRRTVARGRLVDDPSAPLLADVVQVVQPGPRRRRHPGADLRPRRHAGLQGGLAGQAVRRRRRHRRRALDRLAAGSGVDRQPGVGGGGRLGRARIPAPAATTWSPGG